MARSLIVPCLVLMMAGLAVILPVQPAFAQGASTQSAATQGPPPPLFTRSELLEKLQAGGLVMLIRHERTEVPSREDDYTRPPGDCRAQRNLSLAGLAGAQETGLVLRALDIAVGRVISSPMCRSAETARFMFGVNYETDARLMHHDPGEESRRDLPQAASELGEVLGEIAPGLDRSNIALITHGGNIQQWTRVALSEGEIGIFKLDETGEATFYGQLMGSDLAPYARQALAAGE